MAHQTLGLQTKCARQPLCILFISGASVGDESVLHLIRNSKLAVAIALVLVRQEEVGGRPISLWFGQGWWQACGPPTFLDRPRREGSSSRDEEQLKTKRPYDGRTDGGSNKCGASALSKRGSPADTAQQQQQHRSREHSQRGNEENRYNIALLR